MKKPRSVPCCLRGPPPMADPLLGFMSERREMKTSARAKEVGVCEEGLRRSFFCILVRECAPRTPRWAPRPSWSDVRRSD